MRPPSLFDEWPDLIEPEAAETLEDRFEAFHAANPHVYRHLRRLALEAVDHGRRHLGIGMLYEVLRWQHLLATTGDRYKLNNDYRSRYARLLMANEPALAGVFETRALTA